MATLVLTAAGALLGPVGGAVGALIGQAIDSRIFGSGSRQGPRLQDLKVQTSSYGAPIPKLFGTMRVAGTVIWATDLIEQRSRQGGGKGRPSTTTYSYSASFAVLLSARPIRSVGRIWADGNLLRGAAGDWKSETGFRLHLGSEDQAVDPFLASAEGVDATPAYRGCAYVVFEHMALEPFGNRIPSLTFEVEADASAVPVGAMLEAVSAGRVTGDGPALRGFAASGETVGGLIEMLEQALPLALRDDGERLRIVAVEDAVTAIADHEISATKVEALPGLEQVPGGVALSHYEPARDYQAGVQSARRSRGSAGWRRIELPAAIEAHEARGLAEAALARIAREQGRRTVRCGWRRLTLAPGALVSLADSGSVWRVTERGVDRDGVRLELRRMRGASQALPPSDPGRAIPARDALHGTTVVHLLDLPNLDETAPAVPRLLIAAAGSSTGWRRASLLVSLDEGASWAPIGMTAPPATMGLAQTALDVAPAALFDLAHSVEVQLLHAEMGLEDASDARLLAGANLALLGEELIQFGAAAPLGGGRWRLSRLLRGRRGTGWAADGHGLGERFVLIEPETLIAYDAPASVAGRPVRLLASGIGDSEPAEAAVGAAQEALRTPAPVQFTARATAAGGYDLSWIRSSRLGWAWLDGADAPLGEVEERYRLTVRPQGGAEREYELNAPRFAYAAAELADDLASGAVALSVVQIGAGVASRAAHLSLTSA